MIDGKAEPLHHRRSEGSLGTCQIDTLFPVENPDPFPDPPAHGNHPSTGDAPSSPAADASDAGANDARNGVRREIHEIEDALKAFKIAVEAGEMTGFKVQRLPAAFNIRLKSKDSQV
jgi:hypothetical protein